VLAVVDGIASSCLRLPRRALSPLTRSWHYRANTKTKCCCPAMTSQATAATRRTAATPQITLRHPALGQTQHGGLVILVEGPSVRRILVYYYVLLLQLQDG